MADISNHTQLADGGALVLSLALHAIVIIGFASSIEHHSVRAVSPALAPLEVTWISPPARPLVPTTPTTRLQPPSTTDRPKDTRNTIADEAAFPLSAQTEPEIAHLFTSPPTDNSTSDDAKDFHPSPTASNIAAVEPAVQQLQPLASRAFPGTLSESDVDVQNAQPDYAYNPPPEYPILLRERGIGGTVWLRVWVDSDGRPEEIRVVKGSGYRLLDEAASHAVRHWRFIPARRGNRQLSSWVEFPVQFMLTG